MFKRVLSLVLTIAMVLSMVPVQAFAEEETTVPSESATESTEKITAPTEAVTEPAEETTMPTESAADPLEEATTPTEAAVEPTDDITVPTEAATVPDETTFDPTVAQTEPEETKEEIALHEPTVTTDNSLMNSVETTEEDEIIVDGVLSGTCGNNLTWSMNSEGTLTISGTGEMSNYSQNGYQPWNRADIKTLIIQNGVTSIGNYAFYGSTNMTSAIFPETLESIGYSAFNGCKGLTSVSIPHSVKSIGLSAFYACKNIQTVHITDLAAWCAMDVGSDYANPLSYGADLLLNGELVTSVSIPDTVTAIGRFVFFNYEKLSSVIIPEHVTSIGISAFNGCTSLTDVIIPEKVHAISNYLFANCSNLTSVILPDDITVIGNNAFENCKNLSNITIPSQTTTIGNNAFYNCDSLEEVSVPENVTSIGKSAFSGCNSLTTVAIPESVTYMGSEAFASKSIQSVYIDDIAAWCGIQYGYYAGDYDGNPLMNGADLYLNGEIVKDLVIPDGVTEIVQGAFSYCTSIVTVTIPDSVTHIRWNAFDECDNLESVTLGTGIISIYDYAFTGCGKLKSVYIRDLESFCNISYGSIWPTGVFYNGAKLFLNNQEVKNLHIPDGITNVANQSFKGCKSLQSVHFPESIASIGVDAFRGCSNIKEMFFTGHAPVMSADKYGEFLIFGGITATAYYPENDETWTDDVLQNYGGNITWVPYTPKNVNTMYIDQLSVICYANQNAAEEPKESFVLAPDVKATVGSEEYYSNSKGQITISGKPEDWVIFSLEEYASRSFTLQELSDNNIVYLQKESDGPVIHALWSDKIDILHQELPLYYASDREVILIPEISWSGSKESLVLHQNGTSLSIFEGSNSVKLASEFDVNKEIYLIATDGNGKQAKKLLKITNKTETGLDGFTFDLGDSLSFTLPESAGLLAGTKMDLGLYSKVPVKVAVVDGRVYATFGVQWDGSLDGSGDVEVKNSAQAIKKLRNAVKDCTAGMKEYKYVRDVMKNFGYKTAKLSGSCGVDGNWTLLGYVEGYLDSNRNFILSDSGGIMSFGASVDYTQPFMAGPVPMFFELSFSGDIESQFNLYINQKIKKFTPKVEIEGVLALKGGIGVGAAKVASLSGGLKGSLINNINFNLGLLEYYRLTAALDWYIKLKLLFLSYDYGDTISKATWYEYPDPGTAVMALGLDDEEPDTGGGKPDSYDTSQYTMDDLSYLSYGSSFMGGGVSTFSGRSLNNAPFVANAYEGADPQTVNFSDGTRLAVWIGYNDSLPGADALNLYYSYYNGTWSQPQLVEYDGTTDAYPDLKVINDIAYLVWQDASGSIGSSATLDSMATMMDISGAVFDKDAASFVSGAITSGSGMLNLQPKLCGDSSAVYVVWQRNGENDWFGQNNSNSLWSSRFSGGAWSAPTAMYSGLAPLLDFDVVCSGGSCVVAYTMDGDGDLNTTEDLEVYKNGTALTANEWLDSGVTFSGTDLYWYSGGKLLKNGNDIMPEGVFIGSDRFQIVNDHGVRAVVYAEEDGLASVLKVAYYDAASDGWGTPKTLYSAGTSISAFSTSATVDGEISVLIQSQEVTGDFDGTNPYGTVNLVWYNAPMGCDIRVDDVRYYNENYVVNSHMPVYITVSNTGELAVQKLQIDLTDEAGNAVKTTTVEQQILSGETKEIKISYHVEEVVSGRKLTVNVTPVDLEDISLDDNIGEIVLGWEDLSVEDIRAGMTASEEIIIHANIVNRGYQPQTDVTVRLREKTVSGTVLETIELESIEKLSRQPVSFTLDEALSKVYYVTIDRKDTDNNSANNSEFINISAYLGDDAAHDNHSYSYSATQKPTENADGTLTGTCSVCTETTTVTLPRLNTIDYTYKVITVATCTATGTARYTWNTTTYGSFYFDVTLPKTDHSYTSKVTAPTCIEQGYTTHTCSICGDSYIDSYVNALGHNYEEGFCTRCGAKDPDYVETLTGTCGENLTWTLDKDGTLTISGTGAMTEFKVDYSDIPWYTYRDQITKIEIESGVTTIGQYAFVGCSNAAEMLLPATMTKIGYYSFWGCSALEDIHIPANVTSIEIQAFSGCSSLQGIWVDTNNPMFVSDDAGVLFNKEVTELLRAPGAIQEYSVPYTVSRIGLCAFDGCSSLKSITIPSGVSQIGSNAFLRCSSLETVDISDLTAWCKIEIGGYNANPTEFSKKLSLNGELITCLEIPSGITAIQNHAFSNNECITSVVIPDTVTSIGQNAFSRCINLVSVDMSENITQIDTFAFWSCSALTEVEIPDGVENVAYEAFAHCDALGTVTIGKTTNFEKNVFWDCDKLSEITFTSDAPTMGDNLFYDVTATAHYPANNTTWIEDVMQDYGGTITWVPYETVNIIASGTCGENVTWTLDEEGVLILSGTGATYDYSSGPAPWYTSYRTSIKTVIIEEGITRIGSYLFDTCSSITSVVIPESVTEIGRLAFWYCRALVSIEIPDSVKSIYYGAFFGCEALETVTIGKVEFIDDDAFNRCTSLREITYTWNAPVFGDRVFTNVTANAYYPAENSTWTEAVMQDYGGAITWISYNPCTAGHTYESSVSEPSCDEQGYSTHTCSACGSSYKDAYTEPLGHDYQNGVCTRCEELELDGAVIDSGTSGDKITWTLTEGGTLTITGTGPMGECGNITRPWDDYEFDVKKIIISEGITNIGTYAFYQFQYLETIEIPSTITGIKEMAFDWCNRLKSITLPEGLKYIDWSAFCCCKALETITIPSSVTFMGLGAFTACSNLKEIIFKGSAPRIGTPPPYSGDPLAGVSAVAYYPANDATWTTDVMEALGGNITWICESCKDGHTEVIDSGVEATCTQPGLTDGKHCSVCGFIIEAQQEIPMSGHDYDDSHKCTHCGAVGGICGENLIWTLDENGLLTVSGSGSMASYSFQGAPWYVYRNQIKIAIIQEGVTTIGDNAFSSCSALTTIKLPVGITAIKEHTFRGCSALTKIVIPDSVTSIDQSAFENCTSLSKLNLPESVQTIKEGAFRNCSSLTEVKIPGNVTSIASSAFDNCTNLQKVTIAESIANVDDGAFSNCLNLTNVVISENTKTIGENAFAPFPDVTTIRFTGSAPSFAANAFADVTATVYYSANKANWTKDVLQDYDGNIKWTALNYGGSISWPAYSNGNSESESDTTPTEPPATESVGTDTAGGTNSGTTGGSTNTTTGTTAGNTGTGTTATVKRPSNVVAADKKQEADKVTQAANTHTTVNTAVEIAEEETTTEVVEIVEETLSTEAVKIVEETSATEVSEVVETKTVPVLSVSFLLILMVVMLLGVIAIIFILRKQF